MTAPTNCRTNTTRGVTNRSFSRTRCGTMSCGKLLHWIAFQVAQNLVVRPVLLEDEDDMLHTGAHRRHDGRVAGALGEREAVVHGYLRGKRGQLRGGGAWECQIGTAS